MQKIVQSYGTLGIAKGEDAVFGSAIEKVRTGKFDVVRIYAPVGLWRVSEAKKKWFAALCESLNHEAQTVNELRAVFGLPPSKDAFKNVVRVELAPFREKDGARLRYLPPASQVFKDLPGIGMVILGDQSVGIGFAVHGHHTVVDSTIFIQNREIVEEAILWFDEVWETAKDFQLREARREISLDQGLQNAEAVYEAKEREPA